MNCLALAALLAVYPSAPAFENSGTLDGWDLLDYRGDARIERVTVQDCPPGHGPEVLRLSGTVVLLLAKDRLQQDGTYVALYRERAAATDDADGVILFGGAFGDDLSLEHNTKTMRPHVWLEQDNDTGLSFRYAPPEGEDYALAEAVATGLVTDPWNETGWIWQKIQVTGNTARAKYWPAHRSEPADWALETAVELPGDRLGIRINSGAIDLAWFAAGAADLPVAAPANYLYLPRPAVADGEALPLTLFTQREAAATETLTFAVVDGGGETVAQGALDAPLPAGAGTLRRILAAPGTPATADAQSIPLAAPLPQGAYTLQLIPDGGAPLARPFRVEPESDVLATLRARETLLDTLEALADTEPAVAEVLQVARRLLDHALALHQGGKREDSGRTLRFADETLAELHGVAGAALRASGAPVDWANIPDTYDAATGVGEPKHGLADHYRMDSRLRFGAVDCDAASFIMGRTYTVRIPFEVLGTAPKDDYTIHLALRDPLGARTVAEAAITPAPPTSQWQPGEIYWQEAELSIPRDDTVKKVSQPVVLDEMHDLLVSVRAPATGTYVLLGNDPGAQPGRIGHAYAAARFYVASAPLEIVSLAHEPGDSADALAAAVINHGNRRECQARLSLLAPSGAPVLEQVYGLALDPGAHATLTCPVPARYRGQVTATLELLDGPALLTSATQAPAQTAPRLFSRATHMDRREDGLYTPVTLGDGFGDGPVTVTVRTNGDVRATFEDTRAGATLLLTPHFGYYDLTASRDGAAWHERLVATVVETEKGQLLVNGEPFIVKGVNVHALDSRSPARTRLMMEILKNLGFNSLRGDYPPRWQLDLADEVGLTYDVLAPFSVASTAEIFGRQDGPPLATARTLTRQFIARYRDSAAALLWNSCNEITDENIPFLLAQHPLYGLHDPYARPVHYANLYGQDLWQGQDVMGVNYYFSDTQRAADRHPLIERSAAIARKHGLPMIYTEYNSYHGAIPTTGVEAMEGLFTWGVEQAGMAGGYFYMLPDSDRHPGVIDNGYNTHRIMNDAFHRAFDDAEVCALGVEAAEGGSGKVAVLEIRNRRPFTLRNLTLNLSVSGVPAMKAAVQDLPPGTSVQVGLPLPESAPGPSYTLEGSLTLETHHGLASRMPVRVIFGG